MTSPLHLAALLGASAVACNVAIRVLHPLLVRYALARPNARSSHTVPTPQGGGIAVVGVALAALGCAFAWTSSGSETGPQVAAVVVGCLALGLMGTVDDIRGVGALPRLVLQLITVGAVLASMPLELRVLPVIGVWSERALLLLAGVWLVNLVNFMDGIDWITVAEVVPLCGGLIVLGALGAVPPLAVAAAVGLGGALLGFAPFNKPVARLFLGDVGSVPIGLLLVWLLVTLAGNGHLVAAVLLPLYYLADATITLLRRLARRERVWEAHRTHFYQRATDRGFSVTSIVRHVFFVNVLLVGLAVWSVQGDSIGVELLALGIGGIAVGTLLTRFARGAR